MELQKDLREAFKGFFGYEAYPYQIEAAQHILQGTPVILQAPTGAGKTNTAMFPYLYARQYLTPATFPYKLIYSVERRILVNNFHAEITKLLKEKALTDWKATLLTGEHPEDPELRGDMIFTTIDQTLSSLLLAPYSLSDRMGNLNAGAIAASYLVFDEAHLFDPNTALPTLMWMLKTLKGVVPILVMTATLSTPVLKKFCEISGGKLVQVSQEEIEKIPAQSTKIRKFQAIDALLTAESVLKSHKNRSIVVCNTVDRAQQIYNELETAKPKDTQLIMLHARFLKADRADKEQQIMSLFGKTASKEGSVILVATQVIEVGVDITCENLHTELAPANTILQRAGRCARYEKEIGTVYVYQAEKVAPYLESANLFEPTFNTIRDFGDARVTFELENQLITAVHQTADETILENLAANQSGHSRKIINTIDKSEQENLRELIRDADSRSFLVHPEPEKIENPFDYEGFSVFGGTFKSKLSWLYEQADLLGLDWAIKEAKFVSEPTEKQQEVERRPVRYEWKKLEKGQDGFIIALNPALGSYDAKCGFRFKLNNGNGSFQQSPLIVRDSKNYTGYDYQRETYAEHIKNVNWAYGHFKFKDEIEFAMSQLASKLKTPVAASQLDKAMRLAFVFHDAGKLTEGWQKVVHKWQQEIGKPEINPKIMLAHTDLDRKRDAEKQKAFEKAGNRRPPHAAEGAYIAQTYIYNALEKQDFLYRPVLSAIARHHSPTSFKLTEYKLHPAARPAFLEALKIMQDGKVWDIPADQLKQTIPSGRPAELSDKAIVSASNGLEFLLYILITRVLRLADQASFRFYEIHKS